MASNLQGVVGDARFRGKFGRDIPANAGGGLFARLLQQLQGRTGGVKAAVEPGNASIQGPNVDQLTGGVTAPNIPFAATGGIDIARNQTAKQSQAGVEAGAQTGDIAASKFNKADDSGITELQKFGFTKRNIRTGKIQTGDQVRAQIRARQDAAKAHINNPNFGKNVIAPPGVAVKRAQTPSFKPTITATPKKRKLGGFKRSAGGGGEGGRR